MLCKMLLLLAGILLFQTLSASSQEEDKKGYWAGKLRDGTTITQKDLLKIIDEHKRWSASGGKEGKRANLVGADLTGAKLQGADLHGAYLTGIKLWRANLRGAKLQTAHLRGANLVGADLEGALLGYANLAEARIIWGASLRGADLIGANLSRADLTGTDLSRANLEKTNLLGADFTSAGLEEVVFEPNLGFLPDVQSIATAHKLYSMRFSRFPHGLVELREAFKKAGWRKQEREITYAIKHTERRKLWEHHEVWEPKRDIRDKLESVFNLIMFEATCKYGMSPGLSLFILFVSMGFFSIFYMGVLILPSLRKGRTGIWAVRLAGRLHKGVGKEKPIKLTNRVIFRPLGPSRLQKIKAIISRYLRIIRIGLYFSLLSAFSIGWREINIGNWINRMQRTEYALRAYGWVRFVSGIQALLSVYLIALWVLTYFGRPFE